jgi:hypothetical protein
MKIKIISEGVCPKPVLGRVSPMARDEKVGAYELVILNVQVSFTVFEDDMSSFLRIFSLNYLGMSYYKEDLLWKVRTFRFTQWVPQTVTGGLGIFQRPLHKKNMVVGILTGHKLLTSLSNISNQVGHNWPTLVLSTG